MPEQGGGWRGRLGAALLAIGLLLPSGAGQAVEVDGVLRQKAALVQAALASASVRRLKDSTEAAESRRLLAEAEADAAQARGLLAEGSTDGVEALLDKAMRKLSLASARAPRRIGEEEREKARLHYLELLEGVDSFRRAIEDALKDKPDLSAGGDHATDRVDVLTERARRLAAEGDYRQANMLLAEAHRVTVGIIYRLRQSDTLAHSLHFASPKDEFEHERERYRSHEMLVEMLVVERNPSASLRSFIDDQVAAGRGLRDRAETQAAGGDHRTALLTLEEATQRLSRALQAVGPGYATGRR